MKSKHVCANKFIYVQVYILTGMYRNHTKDVVLIRVKLSRFWNFEQGIAKLVLKKSNSSDFEGDAVKMVLNDLIWVHVVVLIVV